SSCIAKVNRLWAWNAASVARHAFSATPLAVVLFSVWVRLKELAAQTDRTVYLFSNTACWMITSFSNSEIHLLIWFLRKSYHKYFCQTGSKYSSAIRLSFCQQAPHPNGR